MSIDLVLNVIALVAFGLAAAGVPAGRVGLLGLGLFCVTLTSVV